MPETGVGAEAVVEVAGEVVLEAEWSAAERFEVLVFAREADK